jgi:hypothetical protein
MRAFSLVAAAASTLILAGTAVAQTPAAVPPLNVMRPDYSGVPVGEIASLEAGAFLARANDSSSAWTSADISLRQLQTGQEVHTKFNVSSIGLVYSISLRF